MRAVLVFSLLLVSLFRAELSVSSSQACHYLGGLYVSGTEMPNLFSSRKIKPNISIKQV